MNNLNWRYRLMVRTADVSSTFTPTTTTSLQSRPNDEIHIHSLILTIHIFFCSVLRSNDVTKRGMPICASVARTFASFAPCTRRRVRENVLVQNQLYLMRTPILAFCRTLASMRHRPPTTNWDNECQCVILIICRHESVAHARAWGCEPATDLYAKY